MRLALVLPLHRACSQTAIDIAYRHFPRMDYLPAHRDVVREPVWTVPRFRGLVGVLSCRIAIPKLHIVVEQFRLLPILGNHAKVEIHVPRCRVGLLGPLGCFRELPSAISSTAM